MKKSFLMVSLAGVNAAFLFTSCRHSILTADESSPAFLIAKSEQIYIPAEVDIPSNLPRGNTRVATFYAKGVQKYKAQEKTGTGPVTYEWVFTAPAATLYNVANDSVGLHGAGPYWAMSAGDSIFAQQFIPAKSVNPDTASIPWLLLQPKTGKTATGIFKDIVYIQRIATSGGKAPLYAPSSATDSIAVPYTAVYRFTKKNL